MHNATSDMRPSIWLRRRRKTTSSNKKRMLLKVEYKLHPSLCVCRKRKGMSQHPPIAKKIKNMKERTREFAPSQHGSEGASFRRTVLPKRGAPTLRPGTNKKREGDRLLVSRQRAVALAVLRVPLLHCGILLCGEQYDTCAAVKHRLIACTACKAEHRSRCLA